MVSAFQGWARELRRLQAVAAGAAPWRSVPVSARLRRQPRAGTPTHGYLPKDKAFILPPLRLSPIAGTSTAGHKRSRGTSGTPAARAAVMHHRGVRLIATSRSTPGCGAGAPCWLGGAAQAERRVRSGRPLLARGSGAGRAEVRSGRPLLARGSGAGCVSRGPLRQTGAGGRWRSRPAPRRRIRGGRWTQPAATMAWTQRSSWRTPGRGTLCHEPTASAPPAPPLSPTQMMRTVTTTRSPARSRTRTSAGGHTPRRSASGEMPSRKATMTCRPSSPPVSSRISP
ncbi:max-like protein X isoform X2 [Pogoniulus pusillus]|uniref:max-like protein X isoform X2 n=1 Tax=Pogoniulus pusillus TaxID=488313 RepID=UPI0030B9784B